MPTYEYFCEKCQRTLEVVQTMSAAHLKVCPPDQCLCRPWGRGKVKRLIGEGAGIIFKGRGFYCTDYRSDNYKTAAKKDSSAGNGDAKPKPEASPPPAKTAPLASKP